MHLLIRHPSTKGELPSALHTAQKIAANGVPQPGFLTISFQDIDRNDIGRVGGKNASLGEMIKHLAPQGINIPEGFSTTIEAFKYFLSENHLEAQLREELSKLDTRDYRNLSEIAERAQSLLMDATLPDLLVDAIEHAYESLCKKEGRLSDVAVRSSATAEDLTTASFAGQHESYLNIKGKQGVVHAVLQLLCR